LGGLFEKVNVVLGVECEKVGFSGFVGAEDVHFGEEVVVHDEGVGEGEAVGFHWVIRSIVKIRHLSIVKVGYPTLSFAKQFATRRRLASVGVHRLSSALMPKRTQ